MRTKTKIWLIIASILMFSGVVIFGGLMMMLKWDFSKLSTAKYETNIYEITENFDDVSIKSDTADIKFVLSNEGKCKVECYETVNSKHSVIVEDGKLDIKVTDTRTLGDFIGNIGLYFYSPSITVYLTKEEYASLYIKESTGDIQIPKDFSFGNVDISLSTGDVDFSASATGEIKIKASTGDITIANISAEYLNLRVSTGIIKLEGTRCDEDIKIGVTTGRASLTDVCCENLTSGGSTGDIFLKNVIVKGRLNIERSTGNVKFDGCDSTEICVKTDTGDVTGTLLSEKVFIAKTDTGRVRVPNSVTGGRCEVTTDTGDIKFEIIK